jgi:phosphopantetheinyl transferase (holo-ACP synthase)
MVFQMVPELKVRTVNVAGRPAEPRAISVSVGGRKVLCGTLCIGEPASRQVRDRAKRDLAASLWRSCCPSTSDSEVSRTSHWFELRKDRFGMPILAVKGSKDPSISFSYVPGTCWAALCNGANVGIDVAESREFEGCYPFRRAFHENELLQVTSVAADCLQEAAALIWSVKEAAVKAAGVGFHLIDPLGVKARIIISESRRAWSVVNFKRSHERLISERPANIPVRSFRFRDGWISVALTSSRFRQPAGRQSCDHMCDI